MPAILAIALSATLPFAGGAAQLGFGPVDTPSGSNSVTGEQQFLIVSDKSDRCLDEAYSDEGDSGMYGRIVHMTDCHMKPNQRWVMKPNGTLVNMMTDRCLDDTITVSSGLGGNKVHATGCHNRKNQQWKFRQDRSLRNVLTEMCLEEHPTATTPWGGGIVHVAACNGKSTQRFTLKPYGSPDDGK